MNLTRRDLERLKGVHPDLVRVVEEAARITPVDFIVTEGVRTLAKQKQLVAAGASRTMNSRHLSGHAVDIAAVVNGEVRWDFPLYTRLAQYMKQAAATCGVKIVAGIDWPKFRDGPHFELDRKAYP